MAVNGHLLMRIWCWKKSIIGCEGFLYIFVHNFENFQLRQCTAMAAEASTLYSADGDYGVAVATSCISLLLLPLFYIIYCITVAAAGLHYSIDCFLLSVKICTFYGICIVRVVNLSWSWLVVIQRVPVWFKLSRVVMIKTARKFGW